MKIQKKVLDFAESLVQYGKKQGAEEVQVGISEGREFSLEIRNGNIEKLQEANSQSIGIKIIFEHRVANVSSSDLSQETLHHLIRNAIERAKISSPDPFSGLPELKKGKIEDTELEIFDPSILELSPEYKIQYAKEVESICLREPQIKKSFGAGLSTSIGTYYLANSNGFSGAYRRTYFSIGITLQGGESDNLIDEGWGESCIYRKDIPPPEAIAKKAIYRVVRLIGARKIETQNVPVILEAPVASEFLRFLYQCINGNTVYMKQSFLAEQLGKEIANPNVTVIDDGTLPRRPGSKPFDREGVQTQRTPVIENGVLKNFLLDTYTGKKLGMPSTGNASGPNNFFLVPGNTSLEALIQSVSKGILITGTIGFGLVPTTGDISQGAFGIWIENGALAFPVAEITLSGNLGTLLKNIEAIGNDLDINRIISAPSIKISEMTIGGK